MKNAIASKEFIDLATGIVLQINQLESLDERRQALMVLQNVAYGIVLARSIGKES